MLVAILIDDITSNDEFESGHVQYRRVGAVCVRKVDPTEYLTINDEFACVWGNRRHRLGLVNLTVGEQSVLSVVEGLESVLLFHTFRNRSRAIDNEGWETFLQHWRTEEMVSMSMSEIKVGELATRDKFLINPVGKTAGLRDGDRGVNEDSRS